jgi:hypothetical protein
MKCCICGTVKNCAKYLDKVFQNIEKIGTLFTDYVIILYYDHSQDNTLDKLKNYQTKNNRLIFYVNKSPLSPYRTHNIAKGRNWCVQKVRENFSDFNYFIMMDFDDVCSQDIKLHVLKKHLYTTNWDAISFNKSNYYDIWGLSIKPYIVSYRHFNNMSNSSVNIKNYITQLLNRLPKNKLLRCCSAFNGFSIYRSNIFKYCVYDGRLRLDLIPKNLIQNHQLILRDKIRLVRNGIVEGTINEDCEHRSFHLQAINKYNAKIFISPEILF